MYALLLVSIVGVVVSAVYVDVGLVVGIVEIIFPVGRWWLVQALASA